MQELHIANYRIVTESADEYDSDSESGDEPWTAKPVRSFDILILLLHVDTDNCQFICTKWAISLLCLLVDILKSGPPLSESY